MTARTLALAVAIAAVTVLSMGLGTLSAHPVVSATTSPMSSGGGAAPASATGSLAAVSPARLANEQRIIASAKADHIPMEALSLPDLLGQATVVNGLVSPITTEAPAPMGIGTYGVEDTTGTPTAYNILSTSWEGTLNLTSANTFLVANDGAYTSNGNNNNTFGAQLNTVTVNTTVAGVHNYSFWTQNVAYYNFPGPGDLTFLDNIWNFSSPATYLAPGTIYSGSGTYVESAGYYYSFGPSFALPMPSDIHLFINSTVTSNATLAWDTISFGYDIVSPVTGHSLASGIYDAVQFRSTQSSVPVSPFLVSGSQLTPTNFLLYDSELMIGGPGGGTTTSIYGIGGSESLQYWNGTAYVNPPSAWNVATDTGETDEGIAETYTTPGIVDLSAGPSIPAPFWNATPGGNVGVARYSGSLSPSNAFVFFTPGTAFNSSLAAWAPTQTAASVSYSLPPGTYTITTMLSDYRMLSKTVTASTSSLNLVLTRDTGAGVYTPLDAWNNAQLAFITKSGAGTAAIPYTLDNNPAKGGLNPAFGELNDYLYQVFPAVMLVDTTAHVDITGHASVFDVTYPTTYDKRLGGLVLPFTNEQPIELFNASNVAIWHLKDITGWFFYLDYGPSGGLPLANVVIFEGYHDLVGGNTFLSQGSSLLLANVTNTVTGNIVWGNTFTNSALITGTMYPGNGKVAGPPIGVWAFEGGDLIYNNYLATTYPAVSFPENIFTGGPQANLENWNLTGGPQPKSFTVTFLGEKLKGTIVASAAEGGNYWSDYTATAGLPFNDFTLIASGGDYWPLPLFTVTFTLSEHGAPATWSVTFNYSATSSLYSVTMSTSSHHLVFYAPAGSYSWFDTLVSGAPGQKITPQDGTVTVVNGPVHVALKLS